MTLKLEQFKQIFPKAPQDCYEPLARYMGQYGITEESDIFDFLATLSHESIGLTRWEENLNYSADRLKVIFPNYFEPKRKGFKAEDYARNPEKIANHVYADKNRGKTGKLGNINEGDGWKYRGSGPIQETGRSNFAETSKRIGVDLVTNPDLLRTNPEVGIKAACEWYSRNVLNKIK